MNSLNMHELIIFFSFLSNGIASVDLHSDKWPDEKATMTYVSSYYHTFSRAQKVIFDAFVTLRSTYKTR